MVGNSSRLVYFLAIFLGFSVALILVTIWYSGGKFFGGGETGLSLWNVNRTYQLSRYIWGELGTGFFKPLGQPRLPIFWFLSFLSRYFSPIIIQQTFFGFTIFSAFLGTFLLVKKFVSDDTRIAFVAGIFYVFNLYVQSQIFARFVFAGVITWAYLPLFLLLFAKVLQERRPINFILFWLSSLIYSYAFSHPAFVLALWIAAFLYFVINLIKQKDERWSLVKIFLIVLVGWVVLNIWWIYPLASVSGVGELSQNVRGWEYNFAVLEGLSRDFTNKSLLLLRQDFYFERSGYWDNFYSTGISYLLSIGTLILVLYGLLKKGLIKEKAFFTTLFILAWFLSKGVNGPLGYLFYNNLFKFFPQAGVFRNSYEKLGVLFVLGYSLFFSVGFVSFISALGKKYRLIVSTILLIFICGVLVWPMWLGKVFSPYASVKVPDYYNEANEYLNSINDDARGLSLPLISGEGVKYDWEGGNYLGLEPSEFLFDKSIVSRTLPNLYSEEKRLKVYRQMENGELLLEDIKDMGIKYLILHNDIDAVFSQSLKSEDVVKILEKTKEVKLIKEFGKLSIYSLSTYDGIVNINNNCVGELRYSRIKPSEYRVAIDKALCPYELILKTSFDEKWTAKIGNVAIPEHLVALGYANGWKVDRYGSYQIDIIFKSWPWE